MYRRNVSCSTNHVSDIRCTNHARERTQGLYAAQAVKPIEGTKGSPGNTRVAWYHAVVVYTQHRALVVTGTNRRPLAWGCGCASQPGLPQSGPGSRRGCSRRDHRLCRRRHLAEHYQLPLRPTVPKPHRRIQGSCSDPSVLLSSLSVYDAGL